MIYLYYLCMFYLYDICVWSICMIVWSVCMICLYDLTVWSICMLYLYDLSIWQFLRSAAKSASNQTKRGGAAAQDNAKGFMKLPDERVNSSITCDHGRLVSER